MRTYTRTNQLILTCWNYKVCPNCKTEIIIKPWLWMASPRFSHRLLEPKDSCTTLSKTGQSNRFSRKSRHPLKNKALTRAGWGSLPSQTKLFRTFLSSLNKYYSSSNSLSWMISKSTLSEALLLLIFKTSAGAAVEMKLNWVLTNKRWTVPPPKLLSQGWWIIQEAIHLLHILKKISLASTSKYMGSTSRSLY